MAEGEGVVSDLTLTIDAALRSVDQLESALAAITTNVPVSFDTSGVAGQLTEAVAAVDPTATVEGDATNVTSAIDDAVLGADTTTVVTGDASEVTGAIDAAVTAADTTPTIEADASSVTADINAAVNAADTSVEISADTSPAQDALSALDTTAQQTTTSITGTGKAGEEAGGGLTLLEGAALGAEGSARGLTGALGESAVAITATAAVTAGLFKDAVQAVGGEERLTTAFGDQAAAIQSINVGDLNVDLHALAQELGSTRSEIDNTVATLQNFGTASGASAKEAEATTEQFVALAARSVALNPQLGSVSDAANRLATVLASGRTRGLVPFNIALNATQIQQEALTETGKESAAQLTRYELAAAGATLATQKYGSELNEAIVEGSKNPVIQLQALRAEFTNAAEEIGKPLIAPIFDTLRTSLPLAVTAAKTFADVASALLPILNAILQVVGLIPQPVISSIGTFVTLGLVIEAVGMRAVTAGLLTQSALGAIAPVLAVLTAAYVAYNVIQNENAQEQAEVRAAVERSTSALDDNSRSVEDSLVVISKQADTTGILRDSLDGANESFQGLAQAQLQGTESFAVYSLAAFDAAKANGASIDELSKLGVALITQAKANEDAAKAKIDDAIASGALTQAQADAAENANKNTDGTINYLAALNALHGPLLAATLAQESQTKAEDAGIVAKQAAIDKANEQKAALQDLASASPAVILALDGVSASIGSQVPALESLAINIDKAKLSQDQIAAIASNLGVSADQLTTFVKGVTDAIDQITTDATSKLPSTTDAIDALVKLFGGIPAALDPQLIIDAVQKNIAAITEFQDNLNFLAFSGLPNVARLAAQESPQIVAAIVQGIKDNGPQVAQALEETLAGANDQLTNFTAFVQGEFGPQLAVATGVVGRLATDAFGSTFLIAAPTDEQLQQARLTAELANIPFAEALRRVAGGGAVAYEQGIGVIPGQTQVTIDGAITTIGAAAPGAADAGAGVGGSVTAGFVQGIAGLSPEAAAIVRGANEPIGEAAVFLFGEVNDDGAAVGRQFTEGMAVGIIDPDALGRVDTSARIAVGRAVFAANAEAQNSSPSKVFAEIGANMGLGLAVGLESTIATVAGASSRVLNAAIPNVTRTNAPIGGQSITVAAGAVVINVPPGTSEAQARVLGRAAGQGLLESVASRGLSVDVRVL